MIVNAYSPNAPTLASAPTGRVIAFAGSAGLTGEQLAALPYVTRRTVIGEYSLSAVGQTLVFSWPQAWGPARLKMGFFAVETEPLRVADVLGTSHYVLESVGTFTGDGLGLEMVAA